MSFRLLSPFLKKTNPIIFSISRIQIRTFKSNTETVQEDAVDKGPIKYSTSKAGEWKAMYTTSGKDYFTTPRSQSAIIMLSLSAFLIYFCILREENDLDDWLREVETNVPLKLEEGQLRAQIEEGRRAKRDVTAYEKRLKTILAIQQKVKESSGTKAN